MREWVLECVNRLTTMGNKKSIRFFNDYEVRAVWDEVRNQWWVSVLDILEAINLQEDHEKNRSY